MSSKKREKAPGPRNLPANEDPVADKLADILAGEMKDEKVIIVRCKDIPGTLNESETQWFISDKMYHCGIPEQLSNLVTAIFGITELANDPREARKLLYRELAHVVGIYEERDHDFENMPIHLGPTAKA